MRESKPLSKVPIGTGYRPELRHKPTWEELEIQHYLLRKPGGKRRLSDGFIAVLCIVGLMLLGLML